VVEITSDKLKNWPKMGLLWPTKPKRELDTTNDFLKATDVMTYCQRFFEISNVSNLTSRRIKRYSER